MNIKYKNNPELIASIRSVDGEGNDTHIGDKVVGIQVLNQKDRTAIVQLDIRDFKSGKNLIIEVELAELVPAISIATLNRED